MADITHSIDPQKDDHGKNMEIVYCSYCPSKILNPGAATYINYKFSLPHVLQKFDEASEKSELVYDCWLVEDLNNFENIGVSNKVENVKYLACADCERGPVGWYDLSTLRSYIALSRVKHEKSNL